jgi:hypothetical protein
MTQPSPFLKIAYRALMIAALTLLVFHFVVYVVYAVNLFQFPFDYDQGEGFELVDTIMFSQGQLPYRDTDTFPFYASNYPPLFHILPIPFVWAFGPAYWYGRLLGFLSTLIAAAAIGLAVYRESRHAPIAMLSGLAFLASNFVYHIGPLFRQHITMVMFETLAVVVLAQVNEIENPARRRWTMAGGLLLVIAAGYTKQLAYATALGVGAWLLVRQFKRAVIWGTFAAIVGGGIFLALNVATNGQWWLQTITANINDYIPDQTIGLYRLWFSLHGFLIVPACLYLLYEAYFNRFSIYSFWFIAAVINGVTSGKWGGGDSYFTTAIAAMCILSGIGLGRWLNNQLPIPPQNPYARLLAFTRPLMRPLALSAWLIVPLLYVGYGRAVLHMPTDLPVFNTIAAVFGVEPNVRGRFYDSAGRIVGGYADIGHLTTEADIAAGWEIVARVRVADRLVLSEEAAFQLLAGRQVITNPTQLLNLEAAGLFDPTELVGMIERQEFAFIILRASFYPVPVQIAYSTYYEQREVIEMNGFQYQLWYPKPADELPSP